MARSKIHKRIRLILAAFWVVAFGWLLYSMQARGVGKAVFESDTQVLVRRTDVATSFTPARDTTSTGLIFYPGALVDPDAYGPLARALAESGYKAVIVKIPFRMSLLERQWREVIRRTEEVIDDDSLRTGWVIGGHSRGGKMAVRIARDHPEMLAGLLLVGTSHPREDDLSDLTIDVQKIFASEDGLASEEEVREFAKNLPEQTHWTRIEGGNHAQFGRYGTQLGDGRATIDRQRQEQLTVAAIVEQLARGDKKPEITLGIQQP